jgi:hypothetical protein
MAFPALSSRSMQTPHPRRELRRLTRLFTLAGAATRDWGATDGEHIWMDPRQLQVKRRCTLAYELEHIRRRQRGCQDPRMPQCVRRPRCTSP